MSFRVFGGSVCGCVISTYSVFAFRFVGKRNIRLSFDLMFLVLSSSSSLSLSSSSPSLIILSWWALCLRRDHISSRSIIFFRLSSTSWCVCADNNYFHVQCSSIERRQSSGAKKERLTNVTYWKRHATATVSAFPTKTIHVKLLWTEKLHGTLPFHIPYFMHLTTEGKRLLENR